MKEKKDRVDDALSATKAALEEGVLPGGGIALLNAALNLTELRINKEMTEDESTGYDIVTSAIEQPFYKILLNAGYNLSDIGDIEENIKNTGNEWEGYNPRTETYVDMYSNGIIDPTKVTRLALENAASVAGTMLITEAVVSNIPSEGNKSDNPAGIDPNMLLG